MGEEGAFSKIDRYLMFLRPVNGGGSYQGVGTKCIPITSKNYDSLFYTHSTTVKDWRNLGEIKLNESGR